MTKTPVCRWPPFRLIRNESKQLYLVRCAAKSHQSFKTDENSASQLNTHQWCPFQSKSESLSISHVALNFVARVAYIGLLLYCLLNHYCVLATGVWCPVGLVCLCVCVTEMKNLTCCLITSRLFDASIQMQMARFQDESGVYSIQETGPLWSRLKYIWTI